MAEGILKKMLKQKGIDGIKVTSAGTHAPQGMSPTSLTLLTSAEHGVNLDAHGAREISKPMVMEADLILVMEKAHQRFIENIAPSAHNRIFLLKSYGKDESVDAEVDDPIGQDMDFYRRCFEEIMQELHRILPVILEKAGRSG